MSGRRKLSTLALLFAACSPRVAEAEQPDPFVPGASRIGLAVATGVPFLVMSEASLGITDYGALGVLAGTTPVVSGFGVRPRAQAPLSEHWRLLLTVPILFYPAHGRAGAWWLARPSLSVDVKPIESVHLAAGAGIVPVATHDALFGNESAADTPASAYGATTNGDRTDAWWTLNFLASKSVSGKSFAFLDATAILSGLELAGSDWIAGPPFVVFLGLGTAL